MSDQSSRVVDFHQITIGTSEAALPMPDPTLIPGVPEHILIQTLSTNTSPIFIGKAGVLANGSQGGYEFPPGSTSELPVDDFEIYRCISASAGQKLQVTYAAG